MSVGRVAPGSEGCGQSSAATTSASDAGDDVRRRAAGRRPAGRSRATRSCRSGRGSRAGRPAAPPGRPRRDRRRPSPRPAAGTRRPRSARRPSSACRKTTGEGLPRTVALRPGRELEADDGGPGVERRPSRRQPPGVAVHGQERGAAADQPERGVEVAVREVVAAVADDHRRDVRRGGLGLFARRRRCCPSNSRSASGAASTKSGRPGEPVAVYAAAADDAVMIRSGSIRTPLRREPRRQRLPVREREVRDDPVRGPAGIESLERLDRCPGSARP